MFSCLIIQGKKSVSFLQFMLFLNLMIIDDLDLFSEGFSQGWPNQALQAYCLFGLQGWYDSHRQGGRKTWIKWVNFLIVYSLSIIGRSNAWICIYWLILKTSWMYKRWYIFNRKVEWTTYLQVIALNTGVVWKVYDIVFSQKSLNFGNSC